MGKLLRDNIVILITAAPTSATIPLSHYLTPTLYALLSRWALLARARSVDFLPDDLSPWDLRTRLRALAEGPLRVRRRPPVAPGLPSGAGIAGAVEFPAGVGIYYYVRNFKTEREK